MRIKMNNDKAILESLVRKYGRNGVMNAINRINESEVLTDNKINDIVNALFDLFSYWEAHSDEWTKPFNAYKELNNNSFIDILDYYVGWDDFFGYLEMDEDEFNELYDNMDDRDIKMIDDCIQNKF